MIYIETIDKFNKILGEQRPPGENEHNKALVYDNNTGVFKYVELLEDVTININSKLNDGVVTKGTTGAINYVWKLDSNLNPAWRQESLDIYLTSVNRVSGTNNIKFTMSDDTVHTISLGSNAFIDDNDFSAGEDFQIIFNKGGVLTGEDAFKYDYITNQLKLIDSGGILAKKSDVDIELLKILDYLGAGVLELGDNVYIREAVKLGTYNGLQPLAGMIQYEGTKPQWHDGTQWNDFANSTDTFINTVLQGSESDTSSDDYKLAFKLNDDTTFTLQLGVNAFNSKFIPTVSGDAGYIQFANEVGDLSSSDKLTFLNEVLSINGVIGLTPKDKTSQISANDGTIFSADDSHYYGAYNAVLKRLDNVNYNIANIGTGKQIFKEVVDVDGNNKRFDIRSLIAGSNVTLSETTDGIQIDATAGVDSGEINIGENVGGGIPIFKTKDGVIFKYYTINGGTNLNIELHNDVLTFNATGSAANNYLDNIKGDNEADDSSEIYTILNSSLGNKSVEFTREGLDNLNVLFGNNAFNSEPIRNISKFGVMATIPTNVGTSEDKYKLQLSFNDTDGDNLTNNYLQLGKNAFNSVNIQELVSGNIMTWVAGTRTISSDITYKPDATLLNEETISVFNLKLDDSLVYNESTNTLGVVATSNNYLKTAARVDGTNHIIFTLQDDSTVTLSDLGALAYLDSIPVATSSLLGGVKIGEGIDVTEDGVISVILPSNVDISRLVSYDEQTIFSDGDKQQARTNINGAFINGDIDTDFNINNLNLQNLLNAIQPGWADFSNDLDEGAHKLGTMRVSGDHITSTWGNMFISKGDSKIGTGANYAEFTVGDDGSMYWYAFINNIKTRVMMLSPRTDVDKGVVYDLHVKGEVVEFSNSL